MIEFIYNRFKSFGFALKGIWILLKTEANFKVQFIAAVLVTLLGLLMQISATEWILQIITIVLVLAIEGLNTAIEKLADFVHPEHHKKIGFIKDIAAGAVLLTAIAAVIIGCIIYLPKFL